MKVQCTCKPCYFPNRSLGPVYLTGWATRNWDLGPFYPCPKSTHLARLHSLGKVGLFLNDHYKQAAVCKNEGLKNCSVLMENLGNVQK